MTRPTEHMGFAMLVRADLYRYSGAKGVAGFLRTYMKEPGFCFTFWLRVASSCSGRPLLFLLNVLARFQRHRLEVKYGISIPSTTRIDPGLFIGHFGGIVVHHDARIGRNCNLSHGVTIGQVNRGVRKGCPIIGDSVFIGPGAKVIGRVSIGSSVAIGANCVVTKDVNDNEVVVGVPARVISNAGSSGYINWTDYEISSQRQ